MENQVLTEEELTTLRGIQTNTQSIIMELGEIELIKLQMEQRQQEAKENLHKISTQESTFTQSLLEKYGKVELNPQTGEITKMD